MTLTQILFRNLLLTLIVGILSIGHAGNEKGIPINNKLIKRHFSKMVFFKKGHVTVSKTSDFRVLRKDSLLFATYFASRVESEAFYISSTEVSNSEYREFFNDKILSSGKVKAQKEFSPDTTLWANAYPYKDHRYIQKNYFHDKKFDNHPVVGVSWEQAISYCKWKSEQVNSLLSQKKIKNKVEFRLPTEAEWETAAKTVAKNNQFTEYTPYELSIKEMKAKLNEIVNIGKIKTENNIVVKEHQDDGHLYPAAVMSYPPNSNYIFDMSGNVSEWTSDSGYANLFFHNVKPNKIASIIEIEKEIEIAEKRGPILSGNDFFHKNEIEEFDRQLNNLKHDAAILSKGDIRIVKGASWDSSLPYVQLGSRQGLNKDSASATVGFRLALSNVSDDIKKFLPTRK